VKAQVQHGALDATSFLQPMEALYCVAMFTVFQTGSGSSDDGKRLKAAVVRTGTGGRPIATLIIADENQGRRDLMANTFERNGFDVTRLSTLQQALATARGVVPDVLLLEAEWATGDALDVCLQLHQDPKVRAGTRTVLLSRSTAPDLLTGAARAGVAEVIGKPVDMNELIAQIQRHASKQFVPPPADLGGLQSSGSAPAGVFGGRLAMEVPSSAADSQWALPMLRQLVEAGNIDDDFVASIREELSSEDDELPEVPGHVLQSFVRVALNRLVGADPPEPAKSKSPLKPSAPKGTRIQDLNKAATLGEGSLPSASTLNVGSMEDILEKQAKDIASEVEATMDAILDEAPEPVALLPEDDKVGLDPETLAMVRLTTELVHELMGLLRRRGALSDLTLLTTVEDLEGLTADVLEALPAPEDDA